MQARAVQQGRASGSEVLAQAPGELTLLVDAGAWSQQRTRWVLEAYQRGRRSFHVIAGNRHDVYALAAAAKAQGLDPREVLRSSLLARAFTAHQLAALLEDALPVAMAERLGFVAVTDPLDLYADEEEVAWEEGIALLQRGLAKLRLLARRRPEVPIVVVQRPGAGTARHWALLEEAAHERRLLARPSARGARQAPLTAWTVEVTLPGPHDAHVPQPA